MKNLRYNLYSNLIAVKCVNILKALSFRDTIVFIKSRFTFLQVLKVLILFFRQNNYMFWKDMFWLFKKMRHQNLYLTYMAYTQSFSIVLSYLFGAIQEVLVKVRWLIRQRYLYSLRSTYNLKFNTLKH